MCSRLELRRQRMGRRSRTVSPVCLCKNCCYVVCTVVLLSLSIPVDVNVFLFAVLHEAQSLQASNPSRRFRQICSSRFQVHYCQQSTIGQPQIYLKAHIPLSVIVPARRWHHGQRCVASRFGEFGLTSNLQHRAVLPLQCILSAFEVLAAWIYTRGSGDSATHILR